MIEAGECTAAEFSIRKYQASDRQEVLLLHERALEETGTNVAGGYFVDLEDIETSYLQNGGGFLVGVLDGKIIAMGGFLPRATDKAEILRMRVDPLHQGRGYGRRMLNALESFAREAGFTVIILETTMQQVAARALYERQGYRESRRGSKLGFDVIGYEKTFTAESDSP